MCINVIVVSQKSPCRDYAFCEITVLYATGTHIIVINNVTTRLVFVSVDVLGTLVLSSDG